MLILLHGATLTAELNWAPAMSVLGRHFRVLAFDQRGHGDGLPAADAWRLEDCADDAAAVAEALDIPSFIAVGYSMGGTVAQLIHRRHPQVLRGLVLCATARNTQGSAVEQSIALTLPALAAALRWNPLGQALLAQSLATSLVNGADARAHAWALDRLGRTQVETALAVTEAISAFTSHAWIGTVRVPTTVVVMTRDRVVPPHRQHKLAAAIPGAEVLELDADHSAFLTDPEAFVHVLARACASVDARAGRAPVSPPVAAGSHVEAAVDAPDLAGDV